MLEDLIAIRPEMMLALQVYCTEKGRPLVLSFKQGKLDWALSSSSDEPQNAVLGQYITGVCKIFLFGGIAFPKVIITNVEYFSLRLLFATRLDSLDICDNDN